jgi:hypothetical protein
MLSVNDAHSWQPGQMPQVFFVQKSTALKAQLTVDV